MSFKSLLAKMAFNYWLAVFSVSLSFLLVQPGFTQEPNAQTKDIIWLLDFANAEGPIVRDRSGNDHPINLRIEKPDSVKRESGQLSIQNTTLIRALKPHQRLVESIKQSNSLTLEVWLKPQNTNQSGPARILTFSKNSVLRNFTLGQEKNKYDVRIRTQQSSSNGLPSISSKPGTATNKTTHVVFTRDRDGTANLWINGELNSSKQLGGSFANWDTDMQLAIGDEITGSRPWKGLIYFAAIYRRALNKNEIKSRYENGPIKKAPPIAIKPPRDPREVYFELNVAPILANQCLECHDSLSNQGGLDLSKKQMASKGDSGQSFVAGKSNQSNLWLSVESDAMPHERSPLSDREKEVLKKWIDDGAVWSLDAIDPAVYVHGGQPDSNWLRRLTIPEYIATINALFEIDISEQANRLLPPDIRADGFSNTAYNLNVDLKHIEAYQQLAEIVVQKIDIPAYRKRLIKYASFTDKGMEQLIRKMGRQILRGPLKQREIIAYRGISTTTAATNSGTIDEATSLLIEAMLQSPRFIYRIERQLGDGSTQPVNGFELASRLSYMITGSPPDEKLFSAAEQGNLFDKKSIADQVDRLLKDPRAIQQSERFFSDWINLNRLRNIQPDPDKFPRWDPDLAKDMQKETIAFFNNVIWKQKRPMSDLLNAKVTFVTPRLAKHYGLPAKAADVSNSLGDLIRYDLKQSKSRGGILTQGSVLTIGGDEASMVARGLLIMHELLRGVVKDPPACVDTTPVPSKPGLSQRAIAEDRIRNETCGGCHRRFEPLAFGLERFDGLGGYHERDEHGNELRDDGQIAFPGSAKIVDYDSVRELMDLMAASGRVKESLTWKLTQFALGRPLTGADARAIEKIHADATKNGGTYQATIKAIATSELVTMIRTDK